MRNLFISIITLAACLSGHAQMLQDGKRWNYIGEYSGIEEESPTWNYSYFLNGDTLVGGKQCLKLYYERDAKVYYHCAMYEEDGKVYFFPNGSDVAGLLYDFQCGVGDVLSMYSGEMVVEEIKDVAYNAKNVRVVNVEGFGVWIENVGSIYDLFDLSLSTSVPGSWSQLVSCEVNGETVFVYDDFLNAQKNRGIKPFVVPGKKWRTLGFDFGGPHTFSPLIKDYRFSESETQRQNRKLYYEMQCETDDDTYKVVGYYREENGKVYANHSRGTESEGLLYDFTMKEGDKAESENVAYTVSKVDSVTMNGQRLKRISFDGVEILEPEDEDDLEPLVLHDEWIEGLGNPYALLGGLRNTLPTGWWFVTAYSIEPASGKFYPYSFNANGWRGQQLVLGEKKDAAIGEEGKDDLHYEFIGDTLHVSGYMWTKDSPNQYIYCVEDKRMSLQCRNIAFQIDELEPMAEGEGLHAVDLRFPFFATGDGVQYTVTDKSGTHVIGEGTSITTPRTDGAQKSAITVLHDLTGRRITTPPYRGMWIEDGVKRAR